MLAGGEAQEFKAYGVDADKAEFVICDQSIEIWFSILVRRLLRRASFAGIAELALRILEFIAYFNRTMAKAFKWTYAGRPLVV